MFTQLFNLYKQFNPHELTLQQFSMLEKEIKSPNQNEWSDQYCDFLLWYMKKPSRQESFATLIIKTLSKNSGVKILEVGCGRTAMLSRILSKNGFQMTCIDTALELSRIKNINNIVGIKKAFHYQNFELSPFDFVIAQEPCEATEHVVRACVAANKPFLMSLCGVPHKLINGQMPESYAEWYDYLRNIAPEQLRLVKFQIDPLFITTIIKSNNF